jgi:hypothetical protein
MKYPAHPRPLPASGSLRSRLAAMAATSGRIGAAGPEVVAAPGNSISSTPSPPRQPKPQMPASRASVGERAALYRPQLARLLSSLLFAVIIAAVLVFGWLIRNEGYLSAEEGAGYWLGIVGGLLMLLLLVYPLRKRLRSLRWLGPVPAWFRLHMVFGVIGPVLVLYHANFRLSSLNGSVALLAMLAVAASGLIGRYLYSHIHQGLYGRRIELRELLQDAGQFRNAFAADIVDSAAVTACVHELEAAALHPRRGLLGSLWLMAVMWSDAGRCRARLRRTARSQLRARAREAGWSRQDLRNQLRRAEGHLDVYFIALKRAAKYQFFERLLSLWHILHLPLFLFLIIAALVHVLAVHLF